MKVKFTEGPEAQIVSACGVIAKRDEVIEVPDEIGKKLVEQGWVEAKSVAKKQETK